MCQAVSPEDALFREEQIQIIHEDYLPEELVNFAAVDLSDSGDDYTVVVVASFDPQGKMYVRQIVRGHIRPLELIEALRTLNRIWDLKKVAIETTGFQRTISRFYRDYAEEKDFHISWEEMSRAKTHKLRRILALQPLVERGYFHVVKDISNTQEMIDELVSCSPDHLPTHDDILDCLADIIQIYYAATPEEIEEKPTGSLNDLFGTLDDDDLDDDDYSESTHIGRDEWRVA
jgi:predicted phage terminase large subunit-like protein